MLKSDVRRLSSPYNLISLPGIYILSLSGRVFHAMRSHHSNRTTDDDEDEDAEIGASSSDESFFFMNSSRNMYHTSHRPRSNGQHANENDSDEEIHVSEEDEDEDDEDNRHHTNHRRQNGHNSDVHKGRQRSQVHSHGTRAAMAALPPINPSAAPSKRSFFTSGFFPNGRLVVRPQMWDGQPVYDMPYKAAGIVV